MAASDETTKAGPANPQASDLDAPTPPGGPLRSDAPAESTNAASSADEPSDGSGNE